MLVAVVAALLVVSVPPAAAAPVNTGVFAPRLFAGPDARLAFTRVRASGASSVRLLLYWFKVAPKGATKPAGFNAADPRDPRYSWAAFDAQVQLATAAGLKPIVNVLGPVPDWAEGASVNDGEPGIVKPSPTEYGLFAKAAATRYSGAFSINGQLLPAVRRWQAWNEPNLYRYLRPQYVNGAAFSPTWYRAMLNKFAAAVHAVSPANMVIAGSLAPVGRPLSIAPMVFMRKMLCMSKRPPYSPVCSYTSSFETWSHHPYACGGPNRHAVSSDDILIADLPEMRRLLLAAVTAKRVRSLQAVRFWATEVGWDTSPPDPKGVPMALHARWIAEAMYRMWSSGVSLMTWFQFRDEPFPASPFQSGFYFNTGINFVDERPKLSLTAFRFPFVAYVVNGRVKIWGRTPPEGISRPVVIERLTTSGWKLVGNLRADASGIFFGTFLSGTTGSVRARQTLANGTTLSSLAFSLTRPVDPYICPFGSW